MTDDDENLPSIESMRTRLRGKDVFFVDFIGDEEVAPGSSTIPYPHNLKRFNEAELRNMAGRIIPLTHQHQKPGETRGTHMGGDPVGYMEILGDGRYGVAHINNNSDKAIQLKELVKAGMYTVSLGHVPIPNPFEPNRVTKEPTHVALIHKEPGRPNTNIRWLEEGVQSQPQPGTIAALTPEFVLDPQTPLEAMFAAYPENVKKAMAQRLHNEVTNYQAQTAENARQQAREQMMSEQQRKMQEIAKTALLPYIDKLRSAGVMLPPGVEQSFTAPSTGDPVDEFDRIMKNTQLLTVLADEVSYRRNAMDEMKRELDSYKQAYAPPNTPMMPTAPPKQARIDGATPAASLSLASASSSTLPMMTSSQQQPVKQQQQQEYRRQPVPADSAIGAALNNFLASRGVGGGMQMQSALPRGVVSFPGAR